MDQKQLQMLENNGLPHVADAGQNGGYAALQLKCTVHAPWPITSEWVSCVLAPLGTGPREAQTPAVHLYTTGVQASHTCHMLAWGALVAEGQAYV